MNIENLIAVRELLKTIPSEQFDMGKYREGGIPTDVNCNSPGCVIGHATKLNPSLFKFCMENASERRGPFFTHYSYVGFAESFFGICEVDEEYCWLFDHSWVDIDNSIEGAIMRIDILLERGLPLNWERIMEGEIDYLEAKY